MMMMNDNDDEYEDSSHLTAHRMTLSSTEDKEGQPGREDDRSELLKRERTSAQEPRGARAKRRDKGSREREREGVGGRER